VESIVAGEGFPCGILTQSSTLETENTTPKRIVKESVDHSGRCMAPSRDTQGHSAMPMRSSKAIVLKTPEAEIRSACDLQGYSYRFGCGENQVHREDR